MLKIPSPGDRPPPLVVPLRGQEPADPVENGTPKSKGKGRKKKRSRHSGELSWDRSTGVSNKRRYNEGSRVMEMLVAGAILMGVMAVGVMIVMQRGDESFPPLAGTAPVTPAPEEIAVVGSAKSDVAILAEAEPVVRAFLEAETVDGILPLVRNREQAEPRIRGFYPDGKIDAPGMNSYNPSTELGHQGKAFSVDVRSRDFEMKSIAFFDTPEGIKIDWESAVGWSAMPWTEFLAARPAEAVDFRVRLSPIEYYNFGFSDDAKWQSYRLDSPEGEHSIYGYTEKGSVLDARLRPPPDTTSMPVLLSLKFPEGLESRNQVIIDEFVTDGWVRETKASP